MKTKKIFIILILALFAGINTVWGIGIGDILGSMENLGPDDFYYTQFVVTPSPSADAGQVQLLWIDLQGDTINANDFNEGNEDKAKYESMYAQLNPGASGSNNPTGYGDKAQLAGVTLLYGDMEVALGSQETHIYMTSFAFFKAEPQPKDGWYFDHWSYVDNGQISMLDTLRNGENVFWPTEENPNDNNAIVFKVKPHNQKGVKYLDPHSVDQASYDSTFRYAQAVFKPVLLAGYSGGRGEIEEDQSTTTVEVIVHLEAKKATLGTKDFDTPVLKNSSDFAVTGMQGDIIDGQPVARLTITFTGAHTTGQLYRTELTVSSKGGSTLTIPLEIRSVAAERTGATLYASDGKTVVKDGETSDVLAAISGTDQILRLNKNYDNALPLTDKTVTVDLNGYTVSSLSVSGGTVTVAHSMYDKAASGALSLTNGAKVILNGGIFESLAIAAGTEVEQNGATITGAVTNAGHLTATQGIIRGGLTSTGILTIDGGTYTGATAITVSGGTATLNRATIIGTEYGLKTTAGTTTIEKKYAAIDGGTASVDAAANTLTIKNGKFGNALAGSPTLINGFFKTPTIGVATPEGKTLIKLAAGVEFNEGYLYFVGNAEDALASGVGVCRIGTTAYARLEDAIAYANNKPEEEDIIIMMTYDYTLPAGYYTLPANATIVVPKSEGQNNSFSVIERTVSKYQLPTAYRTLTFAAGVQMEVFGSIEVSGIQHASDADNGGYNSNPWGSYGHLVLEEGVKLTLQDGAHIYAWGFITGKGEMDARRGSTVHEQFQMGDWKGGTTSFGMLTDPRGVFPVTQYWIQNVESPVKYHPGSVLTTTAAVSVLSGLVTAFANDIKIIGVNGRDNAMFLLDNEADADNTWINKWYDIENDLQVYEVNNTAHIGSLILSLGKLADMDLTMNSAQFKLPITNNMKIHLLSGFMDFTQDTYLLPGAEVEVDKESVVSITRDERMLHSGSLFVYGAADWGDYIIDITGGNKFTKAVLYSPSVKDNNGRPHVRPEKKADGQKDATILVHGQFDTQSGIVYTSVNGKENIISTNEDAGTFSFGINAPTDHVSISHAKGTSIDDTTTDEFEPAQLTNITVDENGVKTRVSTSGAEQGKSFCFMDDEWQIWEYYDCYAVNYDEDWNPHFYIKPQGWVELEEGQVSIETDAETGEPYIVEAEEQIEKQDHVFISTAGKLYIHLLTKEEQCQWWEVEKKENLFHCTHPQNDTYYYWVETSTAYADEDDPDSEYTIPGHWEEKKYTITWQNWDGTVINTINSYEESVPSYEVTYGTMAEFLGTNPTREPDIDYTYNFTGWSPALAAVTADITYTATYEPQERKYTITFLQEGGVEIERQFLKHNDMPVCENMPTRVGYTLQWEPAIAAVTGEATYTATWLENPPTKYEITFYDYDGTTKLKPTGEEKYMVHVGETPVAPENPTGKADKESNKEFTYAFDRWSPAIEEVSATSAKSYVAVYKEVPRTYKIRYYKENGEDANPTKASEELPYGATPTPPVVSKENPDPDYTYTLEWRTLDGKSGIQTVMDDAEYKPVYTVEKNRYTRYTVTLTTATPAGCELIGAGTYDEGTEVDIEAKVKEGYEFVEWLQNGTQYSDKPQLKVTVSENLVFEARVKATEKADDLEVSTETEISAATTVNDLTITTNGTLTLNATMNADDFILESNGTTSGQLINAGNLTLTGEAYFDLKLNAKEKTWYAVAVPWQVDVNGGVIVNGSALTINSTFYLLTYNGATRAASGADRNTNWDFQGAGYTMQPGTLYMIYLNNAAETIRFKKKAGAAILTQQLSVKSYPSTTVSGDIDAGWNGIANPALYHGFINASAKTYGSTNFGQKYNPEEEKYDAIDLSKTENMLIVGEPVFVQVAADKNITVETSNSVFSAAPARRKTAVDDAYYEVQISAGADYTDRVYLQTMEDKEERYVIGLDLAKAGVSSKVAQMWVNRYNAKLCVNTTAPAGTSASFPLGIFVPQDGEYQIMSATEMQEGQEMFVTYNGRTIWNLAYGPYTMTLDAGTYNEYGIKLIQVQAVSTGIENVQGDKAPCTKVIIDNQVYIIREGAVYTLTGQKIN